MKSDFVIKDPRSHTEQRLGAAATTEERLAFLNDASRRIGSTLDLTQTCRETMDVAVPRFADTGDRDIPARADGWPAHASHPICTARNAATINRAPVSMDMAYDRTKPVCSRRNRPDPPPTAAARPLTSPSTPRLSR